MKNKRLNEWLSLMDPIANLQAELYPSLPFLQGTTWDDSKLINPRGDNDITNGYNQLEPKDEHDVDAIIRKIDDEDLHEIQSLSERELESRKGLALMQQTREQLNRLIEVAETKLRKFQSIRDISLVELERRSRFNLVAAGSGESLDPFTSRFLFGPPPPPMVPKGKDESKPRDFMLGRVKSGKLVAVENLRFAIPDAYHDWLLGEIRKAGLAEDKNYHYTHNSPPAYVKQPIARLYYTLGFKPEIDVTGHYRISWHDSSWNKGWSLSHCRSFKTTDLTPAD